MDPAAALQALGELLQQERAAALRADVDALEALQPAKRELLAEAQAAELLDRPSFRSLADMARANVALIQRLVVYYRALAGEPADGPYGADGKNAAPAALGHRRGAL